MGREILDDEGENQAVRSFLLMYGAQSCHVRGMQEHMRLSGFPHWPAWVEEARPGEHLTKDGAQLWLRHLFNLEATHNVELTGAARLYRAASSDRRERG